MSAVVVYESHWGNTAAIARAIATGLGAGTRVLSTAEATAAALTGADLVVVGSPVLAFRMPNRMMEAALAKETAAPQPADVGHPPMRDWLDTVPAGKARCATFDTRAKGPFGSAAGAINKALKGKGYEPIAKPRGFIVTGKYGPLAPGEEERAEQWGRELAAAKS